MGQRDLIWDEYIRGVHTIGLEFAEKFGVLPKNSLDDDKMDKQMRFLKKLPLQRKLMLLHQIGRCFDIPSECLPFYAHPEAEILSNYPQYLINSVKNEEVRTLLDISYYLENFVNDRLLHVFFYCLGFDKSIDPNIEAILEKRKRRMNEFWKIIDREPYV